eukprot:GILJ01004769.1.p1 GENE.GILJ01004769.1~~GILJ01004769.1.p1  ORF type:complete len:388 (-),score=44.44 GILJ01004769.1:41-1204(-)
MTRDTPSPVAGGQANHISMHDNKGLLAKKGKITKSIRIRYFKVTDTGNLACYNKAESSVPTDSINLMRAKIRPVKVTKLNEKLVSCLGGVPEDIMELQLTGKGRYMIVKPVSPAQRLALQWSCLGLLQVEDTARPVAFVDKVFKIGQALAINAKRARTVWNKLDICRAFRSWSAVEDWKLEDLSRKYDLHSEIQILDTTHESIDEDTDAQTDIDQALRDAAKSALKEIYNVSICLCKARRRECHGLFCKWKTAAEESILNKIDQNINEYREDYLGDVSDGEIDELMKDSFIGSTQEQETENIQFQSVRNSYIADQNTTLVPWKYGRAGSFVNQFDTSSSDSSEDEVSASKEYFSSSPVPASKPIPVRSPSSSPVGRHAALPFSPQRR